MDFNFKKKPENAEQSAYEQTVRSDLKAELVEGVPVKQPDGPAADNVTDNPIHGAPSQQPGSEAEMDKILEDVNQRVKSAAAEAKPKRSWFSLRGKKALAASPGAGSKPKRAVPMAIAAVAILVGLALSTAAYWAFSQDSSNQPASPPAAQDASSANSSVTPEDVESLSTDLQSEIDSLDSSQDFDSAALSDSTLGL